MRFSSLGVICMVAFSCIVPASPFASGQEMPDHVKQSLGKLTGEWTSETTAEGRKSSWVFECHWAPDESAVLYHWSGQDMITGKANSGSGMLGWDAAKQLVVELEIDSDGSTYRSTHHILETGEWRSPTTGSTVVDGKTVHVEMYRHFEFPTDDEWRGKCFNIMVDGKPQADTVTVSKKTKK